MDDRVALITGAARGQGRSHALRLADDGMAIIAIDICRQIDSVPYPLATEDDLAETARLVRARGVPVVPLVADVRDHAALKAAVNEAVSELGRLDVVVANVGIMAPIQPGTDRVQAFQDVIDVNLRGVWSTVTVSRRHLINGRRGGSIIVIASLAAMKPVGAGGGYAEAKHGVLGVMRATASDLGPYMIRCNAVLPSNTSTPMLHNRATYRLFRPDLEDPTLDDVTPGMAGMHLLPVPFVEAEDVSEAVAWLASERSRYVTGAVIPVDAGALLR